jgi:cyclin B
MDKCHFVTCYVTEATVFACLQCAKLPMPTLTLARYILELSLMEYSFVSESSSKLAAAALLLALKTKLVDGWTPTLQYYSGAIFNNIGPNFHIQTKKCA